MTRNDIDEPEEEILIWEENWPSFQIFCSLRTQWRTGFNGATGLDYGVLPVVYDIYGIEQNQRLAMFENLMVMEQAALGAMKKS
uniref:Phage protein n=1 Tax=Candidatus Nitrotoga fabula TaxID=2182327 RepID=A0A2X0QWX9_9PROT|nr:conserved protein of unknown function [Candidatus Nitrotoga fabula]